MRQIIKLFICLASLILFPVLSFGEDANEASLKFVTFQVIADQFVFDSTNVRSASLVQNDDGVFEGLRIELKKAATDSFTAMTATHVGRQVNIVFNKKIVATSTLRSSLTGNILITGISADEAQLFINSLKISENQEKNRLDKAALASM